MHFCCWELGETREMVQARIRVRIGSGEASENDRFITFSWRRSEDDGPDD
jgi:hypothetical protein